MNISEKEIIKLLESIDEDKMTENFIVPVYKKKFSGKYFDVEFTGGKKKSEQGCDIIYYEKTHDTKAKEYSGIQVKQGNIDTSKDQNTGIASITIQAQQAFTRAINHVSDKTKYFIKTFIVLTTGEILPDARAYIVDHFKDKSIRFIEGETIAKWIREVFQKEFIDFFKISPKVTQNKVVSNRKRSIGQS
jgi:hypothetical protein